MGLMAVTGWTAPGWTAQVWTVAKPSLAPALGLAGLLLAALLLTLELRRSRDRSVPRRIVRASATLGCVAALLLLCLRPAHWVDTDPRAGVLFTAGSPQVELTSRSTQPQAALHFSLADSPLLPSPGPLRAQSIPDAAFLTRHFTDLRRLRVVGHGLDPWQLAALSSRLQPGSTPPPSRGLERVSWRRSLTLGESLLVQGRWTAGEAPGRLELVGPGGVEATQQIAAAQPQATRTSRLVSFSFTAKPRTTGRFLYRLRWRALGESSTGDPAAGDIPLDIAVSEPQPPRLLWLESAPRFETRHFKNWLASTGGLLALRTTISRDRYRRERLGEGPQPPARLTSERLRNFDLVVVDRDSLADLSTAEVGALRREIGDHGLGLLLLPVGEREPSTSRLRRLSLDIDTAPIEDLEELAVRLEWPGSEESTPGEPAPVLRIPAREFAIRGAVEPLAFDGAGRALAARKPLGTGYSGTTLVSDTFRWILEGAAPTHHRYWSHLLSSLARPRSGQRWQLPAQPSLLDRPMELVLWSAVESPSAELLTPAGERLTVALARDGSRHGPGPHPWRGRIWPRQTGWYHLAAIESGAATDFYGQPGEPWSSWIEAQRRQATVLRAFRDAALPSRTATAGHQRQRRPLPRWPAFLLLLVSLTYLWVDEKLKQITVS